MLASLLFPYDDDSPMLIEGWIDELRSEKCIETYTSGDGCHYVAILNWERHQKIDKPSESKLPAPIRDDSRTFANNLECSIPSHAGAGAHPRSLILDPRSLILDPGPGGSRGEIEKPKLERPTLEEIKLHWESEKLRGDPEAFFDHYEANGWVQGKNKPIKQWRRAASGWSRRQPEFEIKQHSNGKPKSAAMGPGQVYDPRTKGEEHVF
jgi:hypothetical protein